jgi:hypothetical protein
MSDLVSSREKFDLAAIASRSDSALDKNARNIVSALLESRSFFQTSIEDQTQIIAGLHQETQNKVINELKRTRSILLGALSKPASKEVSCGTTEVVNEVAVEDHILDSLLFPSISERYERIAEAHANTYKWIFMDP